MQSASKYINQITEHPDNISILTQFENSSPKVLIRPQSSNKDREKRKKNSSHRRKKKEIQSETHSCMYVKPFFIPSVVQLDRIVKMLWTLWTEIFHRNNTRKMIYYRNGLKHLPEVIWNVVSHTINKSSSSERSSFTN
jgi:hypothetical protein